MHRKIQVTLMVIFMACLAVVGFSLSVAIGYLPECNTTALRFAGTGGILAMTTAIIGALHDASDIGR